MKKIIKAGMLGIGNIGKGTYQALEMNRAKIEEGKRLLLSTGLTVAQIAQEIGFADARYFSRLFRRETDLTPSEYRNPYFKIHTTR